MASLILGSFLNPLVDFPNGPLGVFGHEGGLVVGGGVEGWKIVLIAGVAEGDADVSQEAVAFDSFDGRLREEGSELLKVESEEVAEAMLKEAGSGVEAGLAGDLGEAVPRAGVEAVVAAVDAVADGATEFKRDAPFVLNGEIGNAALCGQLSWAGDSLGRAGLDTGGAFAAVVARCFVGFELEGGKEFAKEKPSAEFTMDLYRGFSIPAET